MNSSERNGIKTGGISPGGGGGSVETDNGFIARGYAIIDREGWGGLTYVPII